MWIRPLIINGFCTLHQSRLIAKANNQDVSSSVILGVFRGCSVVVGNWVLGMAVDFWVMHLLSK
jgi:hypothetical protein